MNILAISGSTRTGSTNTALLRAMARLAPSGVDIDVFDGLARLPVFSPDLDGEQRAPDAVRAFRTRVARAEALIVASPEYVRTLPGGLKNAIDWLVSGEELIDKPVAIAHASPRGDDLLEALRTVLGTVTSRFDASCFVRFALASLSEAEIEALLAERSNAERLHAFLSDVRELVERGRVIGSRTSEVVERSS